MKENNTARTVLCLGGFTQHNAFELHLVPACTGNSLFLLQSSILWYEHISICLFTLWWTLGGFQQIHSKGLTQGKWAYVYKSNRTMIACFLSWSTTIHSHMLEESFKWITQIPSLLCLIPVSDFPSHLGEKTNYFHGMWNQTSTSLKPAALRNSLRTWDAWALTQISDYPAPPGRGPHVLC